MGVECDDKPPPPPLFQGGVYRAVPWVAGRTAPAHPPLKKGGRGDFHNAALILSTLLLTACSTASLRGSGALGVVIERATGSVQVVETTHRAALTRVEGLGDLSHASVVYSRDARYAYVFGRDGGLTKVDMLRARIEKRGVQAGKAIGGAISQDGRLS